MRAVVQRVLSASVEVEGSVIADIGRGLLVFVGAEEGDTREDASYIADKCANLRIFEDEDGKMNLSVLDVGGSALVVSQFTLMGDARKGRRPSFIKAGRPDTARANFEEAVEEIIKRGVSVKTGQYQADMKVGLVNDGPVTILLDSKKVF